MLNLVRHLTFGLGKKVLMISVFVSNSQMSFFGMTFMFDLNCIYHSVCGIGLWIFSSGLYFANNTVRKQAELDSDFKVRTLEFKSYIYIYMFWCALMLLYCVIDYIKRSGGFFTDISPPKFKSVNYKPLAKRRSSHSCGRANSHGGI